MSDTSPPKLGRAFFGYRKSLVHQLLADRDAMLQVAEVRLRKMEDRLAELERQLEAERGRNVAAEAAAAEEPAASGATEGPEPVAPSPGVAQQAAGEEEGPGPQAEGPDLREPETEAEREEAEVGEPEPPPHLRPLVGELTAILAAAEETAQRIVEQANARTEAQITEARQVWEEMVEEVARFDAWREQIQPLADSVRAGAESVRIALDEVPERIRETLAPVAEAMDSMEAEMEDLAEAFTPPDLTAPDEGAGESEDRVIPVDDRGATGEPGNPGDDRGATGELGGPGSGGAGEGYAAPEADGRIHTAIGL